MYKQSKTDTEVSALPYTRMCACSLILPSSAEHAEVGFVSPLGVLLSGSEKFVGLFRELFSHRGEANLTFQVVLELIPLRLFGVVCCAVGGSAASPAP